MSKDAHYISPSHRWIQALDKEREPRVVATMPLSPTFGNRGTRCIGLPTDKGTFKWKASRYRTLSRLCLLIIRIDYLPQHHLYSIKPPLVPAFTPINITYQADTYRFGIPISHLKDLTRIPRFMTISPKFQYDEPGIGDGGCVQSN